MRFAIITDIHGNFPALQAVLEDIQYQSIDQLYCLGDLVTIGPHTNEVLETLFSLENISMITGNHDEHVIAILQRQEVPQTSKGEKAHHEWIAKQMQLQYLSKLLQLPRKLTHSISGKNLLFIHFHMKKEKEHLPIHLHPYSSLGRHFPPPLTLIKPLFDDYASFDGVFFGHAHHGYHFYVANTLCFNPGALGCSHDSYARYGIVTIEKEIQIEQRKVHYDRERFLQLYDQLNVPAKETILSLFYGC